MLDLLLGPWRRARRRRLRARPVPAAWHEILARNAPFVARLDEAARAKLLGDVAVLVAEKTFVGGRGMEITDEMKVTIAAAAARLVLHLDVALYDDVSEIIVYPDAYQHPDHDDFVVFGEAQRWGVVVLSWRAVLDGLRNPRDGHDTAAHEFAHVLDKRDGVFDGAPVLRARADYRPWAAAMQRHFERLRAGAPSVLRDYGATNEAEFFAVATEAFFERPARLREQPPDLYAELAKFYGGDPV